MIILRLKEIFAKILPTKMELSVERACNATETLFANNNSMLLQ